MALALNNSNSLVSGNNVKVCIGVDPTSGVLVDLARSGVTFTLDAGVTYVDTPIGKGVRCTGSGDTPKGFTFNEFTTATQVAHEGTMLMVFSKQTATGSGGTHPARLPGSTTASNNMMLAFDPVTGNAGLNDANVSLKLVPATPTKNFSGDNTWHSVAIQQWNVGGWNTLNGNLFIDGVDAGAAITDGSADAMHLNSFGKGFYASWAGDFVWLAWVNKKMTPTEIADWHSSINTASGMNLVTGAGVAAGSAPAGTVTISSVTPSTSSAVVNYSYSGSDSTGYQYRLNGGTATSLGSSPATISGLTSGTAYTLEVRAVNASGSGSWSAVSNFTTSSVADTTVPTLTGTITFTGISSGGYTATWPAGADNVAVTGYEYNINGGTWTSAGNVLSIAITGRTAGTTDTFQVRAYDAAGNKSTPVLSNTVNLPSSADTTVPTLTGTITSSSIGSTSYTISWPTGSDNVAVTGYEYNLNGGSWISVGSATSVNVSGRTSGTTDTVQVRAYDAAGNRSTPALSTTVTLSSVVLGNIVVSDPLKNNAGGLLTSLTGIKVTVLKSSDFTSVCTVSSATTDGTGVLSTISNAAITSGTNYHVVIKTSAGGVGITGPIVAS